MLEVEDLKLVYRSTRRTAAGRETIALDGVSFAVEHGDIFTLLGPSGCGKTSTLRCIAGLETADAGQITFNDRILFSRDRHVNVPPYRRGFGMVFQSYAIWPHMNVARNVSLPLESNRKESGLSNAQIRERVDRALATVGLADFAGRAATQLSGGQQQRLALARALAGEPPILLLDEPLSNLDAKLRESMRTELKRLQSDLGLTFIYVTHDQLEALSLSNKIAIMKTGQIVQTGSPEETYRYPNCEYVADFVGHSTLLDGEICRGSPPAVTVKCSLGEVEATSTQPVLAGHPVRLCIRPEDVRLLAKGAMAPSDVQVFQAEMITASFMGDHMSYVVRVGDAELLCLGEERDQWSTEPSLQIAIDKSAVTVLPR